ncbi:FKBP-type peptidylprolyl isomerase [Flavobacterium sp. NG2]|uniref:FKBP-type peptidyl-prolyl cis-trans isomerase n=1 Tax=Flavobacterium sp. NG2 TaxID=3097547 RepID=UPI002A807773|nr:FKBP-type peptidylprolyl isomerase [Flavobacterium sp. NG2]WPR73045.1 FKBP-type peptidylprolyl isomerase [Flavobacterium sp. NG2]
MNKFRFYFILSITTLLLFSCSKNDTSFEEIPLRDYQEQFTDDNQLIEDYLNTHYITITDAPGEQSDQDVVITKIPDGGSQPKIMSYLNNTGFPKLIKKESIPLHGITYSMYYLILREGTGSYPTNVDNVLTSYKGTYLSSSTLSDVTTITATQFEEVKFPQQMFSLYNVFVRGWVEVFPQFKTGNHTEGDNGTVKYTDFGAGVMFIPSGMAYYFQGSASIPSYAPLVFSFKLYELQRLDQDGDGVLSYLEDLNNDRYMFDYRNTTAYPITPTNMDDTDGDGIPNFLDIDDDGDGYTTALEISKGTNYLDKNSHP